MWSLSPDPIILSKLGLPRYEVASHHGSLTQGFTSTSSAACCCTTLGQLATPCPVVIGNKEGRGWWILRYLWCLICLKVHQNCHPQLLQRSFRCSAASSSAGRSPLAPPAPPTPLLLPLPPSFKVPGIGPVSPPPPPVEGFLPGFLMLPLPPGGVFLLTLDPSSNSKPILSELSLSA